MARTLLAAAAVVWIVAGVVGIGVGLAAAADLQRVLPELTIDLSALGGAVVAVSAGILGVGLAHAGVLFGMRSGRRAARSVAIVLAATLTALLVALAAAAATSAVSVTDRSLPLLLGALASLGAAAGYALVTVLLVGEARARGTS